MLFGRHKPEWVGFQLIVDYIEFQQSLVGGYRYGHPNLEDLSQASTGRDPTIWWCSCKHNI